MIVVRVIGTYGDIYSSLFADILAERISQIEQCIALPAAKTASELSKQNQQISSYSPTVLFNIGCNFSPIDDTLRGYTLETNQYNPVVSAIVSSFKRFNIESVYPLGYKQVNKTSASVKLSEITIGIGYASNELDIARFKEANFRQIVSSMMEFLYAVPVESGNRTPGIKNRDQFFLNYNNNASDNSWKEYEQSVTIGDTGNVVAATAGGLPLRALKLTRSVTNVKPYYWYTEYATSDLLYDHQVIVSVKADKAPMNVVIYAGDTLKVVTLTNTNWTMLKMDFKAKQIMQHTSSVLCSLQVKSNNKIEDDPHGIACSLVVDGVYKFKLAVGIQTKGTLLVTSLAVGLKEVLGSLDSMQAKYSIYPPESRPAKRQLLPTFSNSDNPTSPNTLTNGGGVSAADTGLNGTYGSSIGSGSQPLQQPAKPPYTDGFKTDMGASGGIGSGSGPLSQVYDASVGANTLSAKAAQISPESNSGYLDDVEDPSTLLTSDDGAFSGTMSEILRAKAATELSKVPILGEEDLEFDYESMEAIIEASDNAMIRQTLLKAVNLLKSNQAAMRVFQDKDNVPKKYNLNKQVVKDRVKKINLLLETLTKK